jgi:hypothetical protein
MKTRSLKALVSGAALIFSCVLAMGTAPAACVQIEGTARPIVAVHSPSDRCGPEALSEFIADTESVSPMTKETGSLTAWIVAQTGWPLGTAPAIRYVARDEMQKVFGRGATSGLNVEALHSNKEHVVYLLQTWRADNLRDRSILLHEIVHHLQYLNHMKALCPAEEERQAYDLQIKWLREQGVHDPLALIGINSLFLNLLQCDRM